MKSLSPVRRSPDGCIPTLLLGAALVLFPSFILWIFQLLSQ